MSITLYQFPLSHFCEKVRWALDYKGLDHNVKNLLPGLHVKTIKSVATGSSVPVLEHDGRFVQGSAQIITYLDDCFPQKKLTPVNSQDAQATLEWERYFDNSVGIHVRRYLYHTLLKHPKLTAGFLSTGGPFWAEPFLRLVFPKLSKRMRNYMDINETTAEQSKQQIHRALKRLDESIGDRNYLVGDRFSRADLCASALLAPLFMPPQYGLIWPHKLPEPLQSEIDVLAPQLQWAKDVYAKYRR